MNNNSCSLETSLNQVWTVKIFILFQVQKPVQYKYLYQCVAEYLKTKSSDPLYQNEVTFDEQYIYEDDDD